MKDRTWKAAIWNLSWEDLATGKYNVEGYCQFSANSGVHLDIPFGDLDFTRKLEETGFYAHSISEKNILIFTVSHKTDTGWLYIMPYQLDQDALPSERHTKLSKRQPFLKASTNLILLQKFPLLNSS